MKYFFAGFSLLVAVFLTFLGLYNTRKYKEAKTKSFSSKEYVDSWKRLMYLDFLLAGLNYLCAIANFI